ncbi:MAG: MFS transporter [Actinobacteria bacterium]|nr:MFS transporter [Actinomycetota bacterium]
MSFTWLTAGVWFGRARARLARPGTGVLVAALAVELVDELVDGTKSASMPLIRHDLALSYFQLGLVSAVPLIVGGLLELPIGLVSGAGSRRRWLILGGGLAFIASLLAAGLAESFAVLLVALTAFFPASGAFVGLSQAALMDAAPDRQAQHMAWWELAGSVGGLSGPLLAAAVLAGGGTWRLAFGLVAACGVAAWLVVARARGLPEAAPGNERAWPGWRAAAATVRSSGALRWLALLEVSDLLLDVLTAFLAVYLVAAAHASPTVAALGVAARLGAGLAGDVIVIRLLDRFDSRRVLRASVPVALLLFPSFLLVPGVVPKLMMLAALTLATAPWYPILQAELYGSLPGNSGLAVSLTSAASLAGGLGPLVVGLLAQHLGIGWAMASLCVAPLLMLGGPAGNRLAAGGSASTRIGRRD